MGKNLFDGVLSKKILLMKHDIEFNWIGIDISGQKTSGKINAHNKNDAHKKLLSRQITALSIKKNGMMFSFVNPKKLSTKHLLDFTQQLQLLLQAGIPLIDALSLIENTTPFQIIAHTIACLKAKISMGMNFSTALSQSSYHFDDTYCHIVSAGERSGQLDNVLTQLVHHIERQLQIKNKIFKALFYPLTILCIAVMITIGMLIFVIPQFSAIYNNFDAELPKMTRLLISMSQRIHQNGFLLLFIIVITLLIFKIILKKATFIRDKLQKLFFILPPLRTLIITQEIAKWSQLLATTLSSRIPLVDALSIANKTISYPILQKQLQSMRESVISGKSFHHALDCCQHFPVRAKYLIAVGENADALDTMLNKITIIYQQKLNDTLENFSKLIEPVVMIGVASLIAGLIIAMYLPIFRMGSII